MRARGRPRFGFPWIAAALVVATAAFAGTGLATVATEPTSQVTIAVEEGLPHNITQASVDAALGAPIRSWEPITFRVTARHLTYDELYGEADPGADVVLSTALEDLRGSTLPARFSGAAVRDGAADRDEMLEDRFDIHEAYLRNLGLGHGPLAVAASARTAADVLYEGPVRTPMFWLAGTGLGVLLTGAVLTLSLRRRAHWESRYRRLTAAQRKLARVVLDLEALEVTYVSTPERARPDGFTAAWEELRESSLELARGEDRAVAAVSSAASARTAETGELVSRFEAGARRLTRLADALLGAGTVHGRWAGSGRTFDRLAAPLNDAGRELLVRLRDAPGGTVHTSLLERLRADLKAQLSVAAQGEAEAAAGETGRAPAVMAWTAAERRLARTARDVERALRRYPHGKVRPRWRDVEDLGPLRESLGLPAERSGESLEALDRANAVARALLGDVEAYDGAPAPGAPGRSVWPRLAKWLSGVGRRAGVDEPARGRGTLWLIGGVAAAVASMIAAGVVSSALLERPVWELVGKERLRTLTIDGQLEGLTEPDIRRYLEDSFTEPVDLTVAVRDAEEYLTVLQDEDEPGLQRLDPSGTLEALSRVKAEFPALVDPGTGELKPEQAIMPVMVFDDGSITVPATMTGAVSVGDANRLGSSLWSYGSFYVTEQRGVHVAMEIEDLARGLQSNGFRNGDVGFGLLFWLLSTTFTLAMLTAAKVAQYGGTISAGLGRFGRGGAGLRTARRRLEALAMGLDDSRLDAVAVLGAGAAGPGAEADQRLFERGLVMAWREADDLAALPLASRLSAGYAERVAHLQRLVAVLGERDADVQRRTKALLDATRGAGGGGAGGTPDRGAPVQELADSGRIGA